MESSPVAITAFYKFYPVAQEDIANVRTKLIEFGNMHDIKGLVILATEGINGTISGSPDAIADWKEYVQTLFGAIKFKDSISGNVPFKRWFVKIRTEIVSLAKPDIVPSGPFNHLSPQEFNAMMEQDDVVVLDTRNDYETEIGMFEGAIDPRIKSFQEFPDFVATCDIPKDKKVLMYCTGGIRCEKAALEMARQGYEHVYQLDGGILEYIQQCPEQKFQGECFVFDHRTAVDQKLEPSKQYSLCPHCGDPGDKEISCAYCPKRARICAPCFQNTLLRKACSKNCEHHLQRVSL